MLAFIVPIKSKTISKDWDHFSRLVERTIKSICNQKDSDFKVFVACHEIPETSFVNDNRVTFLQVDFPPPVLGGSPRGDNMKKNFDKTNKIKFAVEEAQKENVSYIMIVDGDDCVSNKISSYVNENCSESIPGWYVQKGYLYKEGSSYAYRNSKNFNRICGSCIIIKPELFHLMINKNGLFKHGWTELKGHTLLPLPFPASIYSMLNGTNMLMDKEGKRERRTKLNFFRRKNLTTLIRRIKKYRLVSIRSLKSEFSI
ncbi:hypothetical protein ACFSQJ_14920 [Croceitalea marina]|uniref:Glycosyltransferase 2-like domain-containing protein n=1 Tax=Croceitalea marina TaxID=1775166 RepID=A0ABW5MY30_9FLAO